MASDRHFALHQVLESQAAGRPISAVVAELKARGSQAIMDDDFAQDIEAGIEAHRQPWTPPSWE